MKTRSLLSAGLLGGLLCIAASARAAVVTYKPTGIFGGGTDSGTSIYLNGSDEVTFSAIAGNSITTPSFVTLGTFSTLATTGSGTVTAPFTLTIDQYVPTIGSGTFLASLTGTLTVTSSTAYIQFAAPLTVTIDSVQYTIVSSDTGVPGRLYLAPPSTGGIVSLNAYVTTVPEPVTLSGLGIGGMMLLARRRKSAAC